MNNYEKPIAEVVELGNNDILTTSGEGGYESSAVSEGIGGWSF